MNAAHRDLKALLERGRRRILRHATASGGVRAGALVLALSLLATSPLLSWGSALLVAATCTLLAGLAGALVSRRRAARNWPRIWDRTQLHPQTVVTVLEVLEEPHEDPWRRTFLSHVHLDAPPPSALHGEFPYRWSTLVPAVVLATVLAGLVQALPRGEERRREASPTSLSPSLASSLERLGSTISPTSPLGAVLAKPQDLAETARRVQEILARQRRADGARVEAAAILEALVATEPLALWLTEGITDLPDIPADPGATAALRRAARRLMEADLRDEALWLEQLATGPDPLPPPPSVSTLGQERRVAQVILELLRGELGASADFYDPSLAHGGSSKGGPSVEVPAEPNPAGEGARVDPISIGPGTLLREGELLHGDPLEWLQLPASPSWERLLSRPEIEARWLPAVSYYRALQAARRSAARRSVKSGSDEPRFR
ncbi:MAG: hypothetical protein V3T77_00410 [Planctomycetota bacterium]